MNADALGQRRVNLKRLKRDAALLFRRQPPHRAHVVQPVGQFDQQHADIFRHGQKQLAEIFRLFALDRLAFDPRQLAHAINEIGHFHAECLF